MNESQGRLEPGILEVAVVDRQVLGQHHAFVGDGASRHRHHIELAPFDQVGGSLAQLNVGLFADHIELPLEGVRIRRSLPPANEQLTNHRFDRLHTLAEARRVDRDVAPAEQRLSLANHQFHQEVLADHTIHGILRKEHHADAVVTGRRQFDALVRQLGTEEAVRNLEQHAGAISGEWVGADRTAMSEVGEHRQALRKDLIALAALDIGHEPDSAGIMIEPGVV